MSGFNQVPVWNWFSDAALFTALACLTFKWVQEYKFYSKNNWDFSIENPKKLRMWWGRRLWVSDEYLMSSYDRLYKGYPFAVFVVSVMLVAFLFIDYRILSCPLTDLSKCGITIKGGRVSVTFVTPKQN